MPDLNEAVYSALQASPELVALVDDRIWNLRRPQNEPVPALVFNRISTQNVNSSQGTAALAAGRYQLDAYAQTLAVASNVMFAARKAVLDAFTGIALGRSDYFLNDIDIYRVSIDVSVWGNDELG